MSPPFKQVYVDSAAFANRLLVSLTAAEEGVLAQSLRSGRSVLLPAAPGFGQNYQLPSGISRGLS